MIGPGGPRLLGLGLAAHGRDHRRADRLQPADRKVPDTARRRMDQDRPARLHLRAILDQESGRRALQQDRRRRPVVDMIGQRHEQVGRDVARRGIGPARRAEHADPVADLKVGHALAHRLDHARRFGAQLAGQVDRVQPAAVIGVDIVQPDRMVPHPHLAGPGGGSSSSRHWMTSGPPVFSMKAVFSMRQTPKRDSGGPTPQ